MSTISHQKHGIHMNEHVISRVLLVATYFLNAGAYFSNIATWIKICLAILTAITTVMAFLNQWNTFKKNYRTLWIVVRINHVFTFLRSNKKRPRIILRKPKNKKYP